MLTSCSTWPSRSACCSWRSMVRVQRTSGQFKRTSLSCARFTGVAPRAKMNQQRQRRFKTAADAKLARVRRFVADSQQLTVSGFKSQEEAIRNGEVPSDYEPFDSNSITPGTEFMHKVRV